MSSATLTDEVIADHPESRPLAIVELQMMTYYADAISGRDTDPHYTPRKRVELRQIAEAEGWPELWTKHGLTFPDVPADVAAAAHADTTPEPPSPTDADLRREIEALPEKAPQRSRRPAAVPAPPPAPENAPAAPSAPPEPPSEPEPPPQPKATVLTPDSPHKPVRRRKPQGVSTEALGEPVMLEHTCEKCGRSFNKPKTRGRRPRYCTDCVPPSRAAKRRR